MGDRWSVRPLLIVNPRSDVEFGQYIATLTGDGLTSPSELEAKLRQAYPNAIVRRRELSSESTEVWYVYRDGRWAPD